MDSEDSANMFSTSLPIDDIKSESDIKTDFKEIIPTLGCLTEVKKELEEDPNGFKNELDVPVVNKDTEKTSKKNSEISENEDSTDSDDIPLKQALKNTTDKVMKNKIIYKKKKKSARKKEIRNAKTIMEKIFSGENKTMVPIYYKGIMMTKQHRQGYSLDESELDRYIKDIDGKRMYSCEDCEYNNKYLSMFKIHFMAHANIKFIRDCISVGKYECNVCNFYAMNKFGLKIHMLTHKDKLAQLQMEYEQRRNVDDIFEDNPKIDYDEEDDDDNDGGGGGDDSHFDDGVTNSPKPVEPEKPAQVQPPPPVPQPIVEDVMDSVKFEDDFIDCDIHVMDDEDIKPVINDDMGSVVLEFKNEKIEYDDDLNDDEKPLSLLSNAMKSKANQKSPSKTKSKSKSSKKSSGKSSSKSSKLSSKSSSKSSKKIKNDPEPPPPPPKEYNCKHCDFVTTNATGIKNHICKASCEPCVICGELFTNSIALERHAQIHIKNEIKIEDVKAQRSYKQLSCKNCDFVTLYHNRLKSHNCKAVGEPCVLCGKPFTNSTLLEKHAENHIKSEILYKDDKYYCALCNIPFSKYGSLRNHVHTYHCDAVNQLCGRKICKLRTVYNCSQCPRHFTSKPALKDHIDQKHSVGNTYECPICKLLFKSRGIMLKHKLRHSCRKCDFDSSDLQAVIEHRKSHMSDNPKEKFYQCTLCKYQTKNENKFKLHGAKHDNPPIYVCSQCGFKAKQRGNLRAHERTHFELENYNCTMCDFKSKNIRLFRIHKKTHGLDESTPMVQDVGNRDPRVLYCDKCEFKTKYPQYYKSHMMGHDKIEPYLCSVCGKGFSSCIAMHLHKKTHSENKKVIKCSYCDYASPFKQTVVVHERRHTGIKPYECDSCPYTTSYLGNFNLHKKRHLKLK